MPFVNLKVSAKKTAGLAEKCSEIVSRLTSEILKKQPVLISTAIDFIEPEQWFMGGVPLSQQDKKALYLMITVTDETNTKEQKAQYIQEIFAAFSALLGELHEISYVHILDARAAAYGYGGKTQEYRYHKS